MAIFGKKISHRVRAHEKIGLPPGTLVHIGERKTEKVKITIISLIMIPKIIRKKKSRRLKNVSPLRINQR
jgi:hypothetical protein